MAVKTSNYYGKINITDSAIAMVASNACMECYGVLDLVSRTLTDSIKGLFNKQIPGKGVKVTTVKNKINLDIYVVLCAGVNINAVTESITETVRYHVESYTGMRVGDVNVNVVGVRV